MPGPARKHSSMRKRGSDGTRTLAAVPDVQAPPFPLGRDVHMVAELDLVRDRVARLQHELAEVEDRRRRYRLKRDLERAQLVEAELTIKVEVAAEKEAEVWAGLWSSPQAAYWAENPATIREVALYVRWIVQAESGDLKAAAEARQLSDRLGINPAALLKLRAEIENVDAAEDRGKRRREGRPKPPEQQGDDPRGGLYAV